MRDGLDAQPKTRRVNWPQDLSSWTSSVSFFYYIICLSFPDASIECCSCLLLLRLMYSSLFCDSCSVLCPAWRETAWRGKSLMTEVCEHPSSLLFVSVFFSCLYSQSDFLCPFTSFFSVVLCVSWHLFIPRCHQFLASHPPLIFISCNSLFFTLFLLLSVFLTKSVLPSVSGVFDLFLESLSSLCPSSVVFPLYLFAFFPRINHRNVFWNIFSRDLSYYLFLIVCPLLFLCIWIFFVMDCINFLFLVFIILFFVICDHRKACDKSISVRSWSQGRDEDYSRLFHTFRRTSYPYLLV